MTKKSPLVFLERKTGTKNGRDWEIVEFSKDHRNFSLNLDDGLDRSVFKDLKEGDHVTVELDVEAGYDGRGRAVITSLKKAT